MMHGPYPLTPLQVGMHVTPSVGGVYMLGNELKKVAFIACVDKYMRKTIKTHCGEYRLFWFETSTSHSRAFMTHCRMFHEHEGDGLDDPTHPVAPAGTDLKCPVCGK